ncbi:hypothetical protein IQ251_00050 [Saccharopolyspora sp. HNM0983]|uniref:Uncharacterized protein n=1 Tax=Saccharopolyspora montiporae TaxID=2781240 RepID=A0A929FYL8_9PSEU|nr:hypothetical protein [Saccharopolyspora sp. HNM0983]MBE9372832.1 hypothetical protein [Saccharopolyspora sp. HNM0983]
MKYETSSPADPDAQVASGSVATPSDMHGEVNAQVQDTNGGDIPMEVAISSLQVGALQETPRGVVAF